MCSRLRVLLLLSAAFCGAAAPPHEIVARTSAAGPFRPLFQAAPFSPALTAQMRITTWHEGCPTPISELQLLTLSYWDFSGTPRQGLLVVNQAVAADLRSIFDRLFEHGFLIERMRPVEEYGGNDEKSMEANNTSAFNCRDTTGQPGRFSNHSWGRAVDINPLTNPFVLHGKPLPPEGARYLDRTRAFPGSILANSFIVRLFRSRGWQWGGDWANPDFQHFEKPDIHRK